MDQEKIGVFLREMRGQKGLTQRQLAELIGVSDKAVSKWECSQGCPDLSVLPRLAEVFGTSTDDILAGKLPETTTSGGSMKQTKFYFCQECGNLMTAAGSPALSCCGHTLSPLAWQKPDSDHDVTAEEIDGEWFISAPHPMTKQHHLTFAALVTSERLTLVRQWPEWDFQVRLPKRGHGILYWHCSQHGLFRKLL